MSEVIKIKSLQDIKLKTATLDQNKIILQKLGILRKWIYCTVEGCRGISKEWKSKDIKYEKARYACISGFLLNVTNLNLYT